MKNIQVIDGAENCTFSLFQTEDDEFEILFPTGQDVEFADDFFLRVGEAMASSVLNSIWKRPIEKPLANGIHGTLFYQQNFRKKYYPTKKESEMISNPDKLNRKLLEITDFQVVKIDVPGTLYDVIDRMRKRPAMWLGETTLSGLHRFISGYQFAPGKHGLDENLEPPF